MTSTQNQQSTTTVTSVSIPHIPNQDDLSASGAQGAQYYQLLEVARTGNRTAQRDLLTRLQDEWRAAREWANNPKNWNKDHARYRSERFSLLVTRLRGIISGSQQDEEAWTMLEDHRILNQPYMGILTERDLTVLTDGRKSNKGFLRGMKSLCRIFQDYGDLTASEMSYILTLNGDTILLSADEAFKLVLRQKGFQEIPYTYRCVMQSGRYTGITADGVTFRLQKGTRFTDLSGDEHELHAETRLCLSHIVYKWLMWPRAHYEFGQNDSQGKMAEAAAVVLKCLGEHRTPSNVYEVEYCQARSWFDKVADEKKLDYLKPGRSLSGYQLDDFESLESFTEGRKRVKGNQAAETARRAAQAAGEQVQTQAPAPIEEHDPFMPQEEQGTDDLGDIDVVDDIP